jgi:hypothetical protein
VSAVYFQTPEQLEKRLITTSTVPDCILCFLLVQETSYSLLSTNVPPEPTVCFACAADFLIPLITIGVLTIAAP